MLIEYKKMDNKIRKILKLIEKYPEIYQENKIMIDNLLESRKQISEIDKRILEKYKKMKAIMDNKRL